MNQKNIWISAASILVFTILSAGVGYAVGTNKPINQPENQNSSKLANKNSVQSSSQNTFISSINFSQNSINSSTDISINNLNGVASSLASNQNSEEITSPYLPNFKIKYDPKVWNKSGEIAFEDFGGETLKGFNTTFTNSVFKLDIQGNFLVDGGGYKCYKTSDYNLRTLSNYYYLLVPKDSSRLGDYSFVNKNQIYNLSIPSVEQEVISLIDGDKECQGAKYATFSGFLYTEFDEKRAKLDFKKQKYLEPDGEESLLSLETMLEISKTPTEKDYQELSTLLNGIEGIEF